MNTPIRVAIGEFATMLEERMEKRARRFEALVAAAESDGDTESAKRREFVMVALDSVADMIREAREQFMAEPGDEPTTPTEADEWAEAMRGSWGGP